MKKSQDGQVMIMALGMSAILIILITGLVSYWMTQINHQTRSVAAAKAAHVAEAGIELALWKLNNTSSYNGETGTVYGEGQYNITVTNIGSTSKIIRADAYVPNSTAPKSKRTIQVTAVIGSTNIGFNYGVQVGNGGLDMSNSSQIIGNVYANSDIIGTNTARIRGTAIAAEDSIISGMDVDNNAQAYEITGNSSITGNVYAHTFENSSTAGNADVQEMASCSVSGAAVYNTRVGCSVGGTATTPNPDEYVPANAAPLPITDQQIVLWEQEAQAGGSSGSLSYNSGTRTLGPIKINGDLVLSNTAEVVVTGTIWITGQLRLSGSSIIRLSSAYGGLSGAVIVGTAGSATAGYIELSNSAQALGSGTAGSYMLLLSQRADLNNPAIKNVNSGTAAILYAGTGMIEISNNANMKEITAAKLKVTNSAQVTYETGLANANFSSGPGGGWEIQAGTWQLLD